MVIFTKKIVKIIFKVSENMEEEKCIDDFMNSASVYICQ